MLLIHAGRNPLLFPAVVEALWPIRREQYSQLDEPVSPRFAEYIV
jgi:hypothetical protein